MTQIRGCATVALRQEDITLDGGGGLRGTVRTRVYLGVS